MGVPNKHAKLSLLLKTVPHAQRLGSEHSWVQDLDRMAWQGRQASRDPKSPIPLN